MAGIQISALPAVVTPALTDVFPIDQAGVTYKESLQQVLDLFQSNGATLTRVNDTNVTITLTGTPATALLEAVTMTLGWSGTLAPARGGLGISTVPTNGQIPIGNGTNYTAAAITAGAGIAVTNGAGSISIATTTDGLEWSETTGDTIAAAVNNAYIIGEDVGLVTVTLPATAELGNIVHIQGKSSNGWLLQANTGQTIHVGDTSSSVAGSAASTNRYDTLTVVCITADTEWAVPEAPQTNGLNII